jgi:methenyltetrahydromethanopterin cyclohydrolase
MSTLNERAHELCNAMVADADELDIAVSTLECGTRIIDCGVKSAGSIEAGQRLAEVCLAGLGRVRIYPERGGIWDADSFFDPSPLYPGLGTKFVVVTTDQPMTACMASQYAGWQISSETFFAMGSGPMRAAACREELFKAIGHCEKPSVCVGVLETSKLPPDSVCIDIAEKCGIKPSALTLLAARTSSPAGTVQIVARSVETALHKLHELGFDLSSVTQGVGFSPLPPAAPDDSTALGWTNDAILYGASVYLNVTASRETIEKIGPRVPSSASPDYGVPFAEIFARYGNDFYKIDPMLFSPAEICFINVGLMFSSIPSPSPTKEKQDEFRFTWEQFGFTASEPHFGPIQFSFGRLAPEILAASFSANK